MNSNPDNKMHIVIIDDEESICRSYVDELVWGYDFDGGAINCYSDPRIALSYLQENCHTVDVILLDLKMPDIDGLDMLRHIRSIDNEVEIIVISAFASIESVKQAVNNEEETRILKKSVDKPVIDFNALVKLIKKAAQQRRADNEC